MGEAPARPARFLKTHYIIAALVPALLVLLAITGFVWAQKGVTVVVDGESLYMKTQAADVAGLLSQAGIEISEGDVVSPAPDSALTDGATVVVRHAIPVVVLLSGERLELNVVGSTVADAVVAAGADAGASLVTEPPLDAALSRGMTITVSNVFVRVLQEEVAIPFETVTRNDSSSGYGTRTIETQGVDGKMLRVYRVVVTDGVEGPRTLVAEQVVTPPTDEVVVVGTKRTSQVTRSKAPAPDTGTKLTVTSTAYAPGVDGVGVHTATGSRAGYGTIAVDPNVIPLGTRLYIPGYGYGVAADTGGAINGAKIDVCFNSRAEALAWGRRTVTITLLP